MFYDNNWESSGCKEDVTSRRHSSNIQHGRSDIRCKQTVLDNFKQTKLLVSTRY